MVWEERPATGVWRGGAGPSPRTGLMVIVSEIGLAGRPGSPPGGDLRRR